MKKDRKSFVIGLIITIVADIICAGLVFLLQYLSLKEKAEDAIIVAVLDSLLAAGGMGVLIYLLSVVAEQGAFDIFSYSIKLVWYNTFHRNIRETALPKNYTEYKMLKRGKPKNSTLYILLGSLPCVLAGLITMIPYYIIYR